MLLSELRSMGKSHILYDVGSTAYTWTNKAIRKNYKNSNLLRIQWYLISCGTTIQQHRHWMWIWVVDYKCVAKVINIRVFVGNLWPSVQVKSRKKLKQNFCLKVWQRLANRMPSTRGLSLRHKVLRQCLHNYHITCFSWVIQSRVDPASQTVVQY